MKELPEQIDLKMFKYLLNLINFDFKVYNFYVQCIIYNKINKNF